MDCYEIIPAKDIVIGDILCINGGIKCVVTDVRLCSGAGNDYGEYMYIDYVEDISTQSYRSKSKVNGVERHLTYRNFPTVKVK